MLSENEIANVSALADLAKDKGLRKLRVKLPTGFEIELDTGLGNDTVPVIQAAPKHAPPPVIDISRFQAQSGNAVTAPLIGTYYAAPSENKPPFVKVGDTVKKGQTLCIIESMKLMNELQSEFDGVVTEITAVNGNVVEYGETLMRIE
ncbi:MAG: acetyl-CoA carboxylase, biotin carboxyl carrier protein [Oscillospiraceae bacterium]|jgi:acetyl-CoA carboxylase biotin carboxyl carrier protein|nr:acetyl-CoA carboxylase, biotin carboxyl carrier protein [Oscillospiraceae bacterium]